MWWREFLWQLVRTTFVSHANFLFSPVVAWFLCAPKYLNGEMSLGELTQSAAAFVVVQGAFNWLVDNYQRVADWRASVTAWRPCWLRSMTARRPKPPPPRRPDQARCAASDCRPMKAGSSCSIK